MENTKQNQVVTKSTKNPKKITRPKTQKEKSTRFQENYFNPKLHKRNWEPSGKFQEKNKYTLIKGYIRLIHCCNNFAIFLYILLK